MSCKPRKKVEDPMASKVKEAPLTDAEIDSLLCELSSDEIEKLLDDVTGPDDTHMPPSARFSSSCHCINPVPTAPFLLLLLLLQMHLHLPQDPHRPPGQESSHEVHP